MREGVRKVEAMAPIVKTLTDDDLNALGAYYAKLPAKPSGETIDPALVKRGAELAAAKVCASCHGAALQGQDQIPRIAKQRVDYLIDSLKAYRDGTRPSADTIMSSAVADFPTPTSRPSHTTRHPDSVPFLKIAPRHRCLDHFGRIRTITRTRIRGTPHHDRPDARQRRFIRPAQPADPHQRRYRARASDDGDLGLRARARDRPGHRPAPTASR